MQEQNGAVKQRRGPGFLRYIPVKIILTIAILAAVFGAGVGVRSVLVSGNKLTRLGFEDIGELATQAAYCTEVNVTEAAREFYGITIPFTQSKYIYSYNVEIQAGFDLVFQHPGDERRNVDYAECGAEQDIVCLALQIKLADFLQRKKIVVSVGEHKFHFVKRAQILKIRQEHLFCLAAGRSFVIHNADDFIGKIGEIAGTVGFHQDAETFQRQ